MVKSNSVPRCDERLQLYSTGLMLAVWGGEREDGCGPQVFVAWTWKLV